MTSLVNYFMFSRFGHASHILDMQAYKMCCIQHRN